MLGVGYSWSSACEVPKMYYTSALIHTYLHTFYIVLITDIHVYMYIYSDIKHHRPAQRATWAALHKCPITLHTYSLYIHTGILTDILAYIHMEVPTSRHTYTSVLLIWVKFRLSLQNINSPTPSIPHLHLDGFGWYKFASSISSGYSIVTCAHNNRSASGTHIVRCRRYHRSVTIISSHPIIIFRYNNYCEIQTKTNNRVLIITIIIILFFRPTLGICNPSRFKNN